jgi:transcriptional regulator with PAS, ATPase and Fis domain
MAGADDDSSPTTAAPETTLSLDPSGAHALVRQLRLHVVDGPDRGKTFVSSAERTVIGTHAAADLVLSDSTVSRFHAEIGLDGGRAVLRDLGSRNGTVVNGLPVLAAPLADGATMVFGKTSIVLDPGGEIVKLPLSARSAFGVMVGGSVTMRRVYAALERAAACDATVLLEGETGTGKEAAAESIHRESARQGGPFVVVDCSALPANLLESELFGHERGAFTGATGPREGAFEAAAGGTVFLDEIGELAPDLQPKLLRVLERREIKRLGANVYRPVDVRIVAATNRSLRGEVNLRRFRSDLYYRLAVLVVLLPPLRERTSDIPALVERLLESRGAAGRPDAAFARTPEFAAELARHAWPGNVRELRNHIERCLALNAAAPLGAEGEAEPGAAFAVDVERPLRDVRDAAARAVERRYLEAVLDRHGHNVTAAARAAGVDRIHFYRLLSRHGLRPHRP